MRLGKQVWAVLSACTAKLCLFSSPTLDSYSRWRHFKPTFRPGAGCSAKGSAVTEPDVRHLIPLCRARFHTPGQHFTEFQTFISFASSKPNQPSKQAIFPWESRECVIGSSDFFQITHGEHFILCIIVRCKTPHPTLAWLELSPKHYTWCDQEN